MSEKLWRWRFAWYPVMVYPGRVVWLKWYEWYKEEWIAPNSHALFPVRKDHYRSQYGVWEDTTDMVPFL